ncbi:MULTISPECIES: hypothetical protein [unclassified Lysobacter]|uniref:SecDF P1 head subdomain-containing protein n=1 Tax=unclassified Lysobacter TaxID=2635362 RepID=UPI000A567E37|nr:MULTISPECIES: hypothetical protein [unclassified Lysobacter]
MQASFLRSTALRSTALAIAVLVPIALAGCMWRPQEPITHTPRADVGLHSASREPCPGCLERKGPDGQTVYLRRRPLLSAQHIAAVSKVIDIGGGYAIQLDFKPEAQDRVRSVSEEQTGKLIAWVAQERVLSVAVNRGVFSSGMRLSGITAEEADQIYTAMTGDPTQRRPSLER